MRPPTHTKSPHRIDLPLRINDHAHIPGPGERFEPSVRGGAVAVGDGDEVDVWMGGGGGAEGEELFFGKGTAAVAEEGQECGFVGY